MANLWSVEVNLQDVALTLGSAWYLAAAFIGLRARQRLPSPWAGASRRVLLGMLLLIAYAWLSTSWSGLDGEDLAGMRWTLLPAAAGPLLAWGVLAGTPPEEVRRFLWRLTGFLGLVSVIYAAESLLSLGLRSERSASLLTDFGMQRVRGPLFGASTGYLALVPALGFALQTLVGQKRRRGAAAVVLLALLVAMLGLGSRAALILLAAFIGTLMLLVRNRRKKVVMMGVTVVLIACSAGLVFSRAVADRLWSLEDDSRRATHLTAWRTVAGTSLPSLLLGAGYGGVWPWYEPEVHRPERLATGDNLTRTAHGISLYHSHSTILELGVELGLPGVLFLAGLIVALGAAHRRSWRSSATQIFSCSLAISLISLFFDLFLFKNPKVNLIWWCYVAGGLSMLAAGAVPNASIHTLRRRRPAIP